MVADELHKLEVGGCLSANSSLLGKDQAGLSLRSEQRRVESIPRNNYVRMPERSRGRSAKPVFVGSNPTSHSMEKASENPAWILRKPFSLMYQKGSKVFADTFEDISEFLD